MTLVVVSFLTFMLMDFAPGDPAQTQMKLSGVGGSEELLEQLREEMGLNDPLIIRYGRWAGNILRGDFGVSYRTGKAISTEVKGKLRNTLHLTLIASGLLILIAFPLGILSAIYKNTLLDFLIQMFSFFGISIPNFWFGLILIQIFAIKLKMLPSVSDLSGKSLILPVATISLSVICIHARQIRSALLEEMGKTYVSGLRAKGIRKSKIIVYNVVPNSLNSVITLMGLSIGSMLAGSAIVEQLFSYPGMGKWALESIAYRDYPVIQAYVLVVSTAFVLINLAADTLITILNPGKVS